MIDYTRKLSDEIRDLWTELDKQQNRGATLHELNAGLRASLQDQHDRAALLLGTIGRLEDTIQALLGYTECGCGEDEEGRYGKCVPCFIRDEGIYP